MRVGKNTESKSRFASVVSKKVDGSAVVRNALRRKMYSALAEEMPSIKSGFVVLVFAKKGSENLSFQILKNEVEGLLDRAELRINR